MPSRQLAHENPECKAEFRRGKPTQTIVEGNASKVQYGDDASVKPVYYPETLTFHCCWGWTESPNPLLANEGLTLIEGALICCAREQESLATA